jgi:putative transposase
MTQPRQILPERFYMSTRRCARRQLILRPDEETNNAFAYCLAEAAERFQIELIVAQLMSNHYHAVLFDRYGHIIEFIEHFHKLVAKSQNALRGRCENLWSTTAPSLVELVETSDVIDKIVYVATNPVLDNLVERVDHWPGPKMVGAMLRDELLTSRRPDHFFRTDGVMPREATLRFVIPAELGDRDAVLQLVRQRIVAVEQDEAQKRAARGTCVLGRRNVRLQSWKSFPSSEEPRRNLNPRVAAKNVWSRVATLCRNKAFQREYRNARAALPATPIPFPLGTYWLARFAGVPVVAFEN